MLPFLSDDPFLFDVRHLLLAHQYAPDSVLGPMPFSFKRFLSDFIRSHDLQADSSSFISDLQFPIPAVFWASTYGVSTGILQNW